MGSLTDRSSQISLGEKENTELSKPETDHPRLRWFSRTSRGSRRKQNAPAQQVEAGGAVALPLQQLEPALTGGRLPTASACQGGGVDQPREEASVGQASTIGLDIAKRAFRQVGRMRPAM